MNQKNLALVVAAVVIVAAVSFLEVKKPDRAKPQGAVTVPTMSRAEKETRYEPAKEISSPDGFLNTPSTSSGQATPITIGEFVGKKVVLVDFWTYSCINCKRTIPYLNAWYEKYRDKGLVIIGIHTPEFEFEKKYENVSAAVEKFGITYPVVLDNDYSTWTDYRNRYWPRKYLIDIDGFTVYDHIGEGGYEEIERKIQEALAERMEVLGIEGTISEAFANPGGADVPNAKSPETYFGALRNENFGNGTRGVAGTQNLSIAREPLPNTLYLSGTWDITPEFAENVAPDASILFTFSAKKVFLVASGKDPVQVSVLLDGKPIPDAEAGADVTVSAQTSTLTIREDRLYEVVNGEYGTHTLELRPHEPGLKAFTFTFG